MKRRNNNKMQAKGKNNKSFSAHAHIDIGILPKDQLTEAREEISSAEFVNAQWARFFDRNSSFYCELEQLIKNSPTLSRVLQDQARMILGEGFDVVSSESRPILSFFKKMAQRIFGDAAAEAVNELIADVNMHNETLSQVMYKLAYDYIAFGNCFVELIKTQKQGEPVVYINHIPIEQVGVKKVNELGVSTHIAVSKYWEKGYSPQVGEFSNRAKVLPMYPNFIMHKTVHEDVVVEHERSAIHIKNYAPAFEYWGLPGWVAARFWAEIEYRIPNYNISKFKNGFMPSAIVQFMGSNSQEEAEELIEEFTEAFTDTGNGSKIMLQVISDERDKAQVQTFEDKSEGNYIELSRLAAQQLVTSLCWTMSLAGHATQGKLGTNQQMRDEIEYVTNMCIKPIRAILLDRAINVYIKTVADHTNESALNNIYLTIANMQPISFASQIDVNANLTTNEKRKAIGYDALTPEQLAEQNIIDNASTGSIDPVGGGD